MEEFSSLIHLTQQAGEFVEPLKTKAETLFSYFNFKRKEQQGTISENQLQSLLEIEFDEYLKEKGAGVLPTTFDPEVELKRIVGVPKDERRSVFKEFGEKYVVQRESLAQCYLFIRRLIVANNEIKKEKLLNWFNRFATHFGFSEKQREMFDKMLESYYEVRNRMKKLREEFPNDIQLIAELTGLQLDPKTKCKVEMGSLSFNMYCDGKTALKIYYDSTEYQSKNPLESQVLKAFAARSAHTPYLPYNVFNQDSLFNRFSEKKSIKHETKHQENKLFIAHFESIEADLPLSKEWEAYKRESDPELKVELLKVYLDAERDRVMLRVRDEFIAMNSDDHFRTKSEFNFLYLDQKDSPYIASIEDREKSQLYEAAFKKLVIDESRPIFTKAIEAFYTLSKRYKKEMAIALLSDQPMKFWPKVARRFLSSKD